MSNWQQKLEKKVKDYLAGCTACHDFWHHERVKNWALEIAGEIKCDTDVLVAAALLHDIGYKGHAEDDRNHFKYSVEVAAEWLPEVGFPEEKIKDVLEAIRLHDNYSWGHNHEPTDHTETLILQDADRMEALGAIGVARLVYFFGEHGYPIYNADPVPETDIVWLDHSVTDQMKREALKKWENLNFPISKKLGEKRHRFVVDFYHELKKELQRGEA